MLKFPAMKKIITISIVLFLIFANNSVFASTPSDQIVCPDDITISCCQDYDNLDITGDPAKKNHNFNYFTKVDSVGIDECREGIIKRIWTGHNLLGEFSCVQWITMERNNQFNGQIKWPKDWAGSCGDVIPYTEPEYDVGFCDQIGHNFKDDTFRFTDDACMKILRNWRIMDWCEYQPNSGSNNGIWEHTQVLMIVDQTAPEITECKTRTIDATNSNCSATFTLHQEATDANCGELSKLTWYYELDYNNDWQIDTTGSIEGANADLELYNIPTGTHKIKWKVFDGCANVATCMETIKVIDKKPPTLYCYLSTTFNLTPMPGKDSLDYPARNFVKEAFDNCTDKNDIVFSYSADLKDSVKTFTCNDLGFQFLRIFAIDKAGNSDFTYILVRVGINGPCTFNSIQGNITDMHNNPVNDIHVALYGKGVQATADTTDKSGSFSFPYKESEVVPKLKLSTGKYTVPKIDINSIRKIADYLLGKTSLTKQQIFASDLNNDGTITASDILVMRNLLLGKKKYSEIENPAKFFAKDSTNTYKEVEYIEDILNKNVEIKCVLKGDLN